MSALHLSTLIKRTSLNVYQADIFNCSQQGLDEIVRATELDPLSSQIRSDMAVVLAAQGNNRAAVEQARRALELDPPSDWARFFIGWIHLQAGKVGLALPEFQKAKEIGATGYETGYLGYAYAAAGDRTRAMAVMEELRQESSRRFVSPLWPAIIYLGLGDRERSLDGLEKAYNARDPWLSNLKIDKIYDPIRSDPRFIELLSKVGLDNAPSHAVTVAPRPGL